MINSLNSFLKVFFVTLFISLSGAVAQAQTTPEDTTSAPPPAPAEDAQTAQPTPSMVEEFAPEYLEWQRVADRADEAIENARASTSALETLRQELADWRQRFSQAQNVNQNAIATAQRQLEALGPAPAEGETEATDMSIERDMLTTRLNRLQAPVRAAELAFTRADGLISGIDQIIRNRQAEELMEFGPSPLNPVNWPEGLAALNSTVAALRSEIASAWSNPVQKAETRGNLPAILVFSALGLILILRGRRWTHALTDVILTQDAGAARWIGGFIVSLGSLVLPLCGVYLVIEAIYSTGLVGLRGDQKLRVLGPLVFTFLLARWLASRVFPADEARTLPLKLSRENRRRGRVYGAVLGALASASFFLQEIGQISGWSDEATVVLIFPFVVLCSLLMWRLAALLRAHVHADGDDEAEETYRMRLTRVLAFLVVALAVVAPVLAAVGYFKLSLALLYPSLATLQLLAVLLVLQRLVVEVYVLLTGNREDARDSLIPILIGFLLVLVALPVFALIWGARVADLTELWTRFSEGLTVGDTRISPTIFLTFAIVFVLGYTATRLLQGVLKNSILPKTRMDMGGRNAVVSGVGYLGIFLAAVIAITSAGIDLSSIAIVAGALSVGIGFGLQTIVSNFVSGIILLIERPISEGDWIEVGGVHGTVRQISVRATVIQTFDRSDVIVPNSDLVSGQVTNYTRGNTVGRVIVPVGVAYGTDTKRVETILQEIAEAHPLVLLNPPPAVVFRSFGADSLDFEIRAILRDVNYVLSVHSEMNHEIARRFVEEGIEIPFAQRDIWIRNPEAFGGKPDTGAGQASVPAATASAPAGPRHFDEPADSDGVDSAQEGRDADSGDGAGDADGDAR